MLKKEKKEPSLGDIKAFLGEGTEFKGILSFEGTVRIDGRLEGEIISKDLLIVGETAHIKAEIDVGRMINSGRIEGNISAQQKIEILPPGRVEGHIRTPNLILVEGAKFNGTCEMMTADSTQRNEGGRVAAEGTSHHLPDEGGLKDHESISGS